MFLNFSFWVSCLPGPEICLFVLHVVHVQKCFQPQKEFQCDAHSTHAASC